MIGSRVASAFALLGILIILQRTTGELFLILVGVILVLLPALQWGTVYFFGKRAGEHPEILSLRVKTQDQAALALAQTDGAFLGALVLLRAANLVGPVDRSVFTIGLTWALLLVAAPAINNLIVWRPWRQEEHEHDDASSHH